MQLINDVSELKPYSAKELSSIYGICEKTFKKWIQPFQCEVGERQGRYYNVAQVKIIFSRLGLPCKIYQASLFD